MCYNIWIPKLHKASRYDYTIFIINTSFLMSSEFIQSVLNTIIKGNSLEVDICLNV